MAEAVIQVQGSILRRVEVPHRGKSVDPPVEDWVSIQWFLDDVEVTERRAHAKLRLAYGGERLKQLLASGI